jgi:RNA polymerase sigma-70 factor (ECF subfamily)
VRGDLVERALDLARMLRKLMPDEREVRGLLLLEEQDRSAWDQAAIEEGHRLVVEALRGGKPGRFGLQAAIAALHAAAPSYTETDWPQVLTLYTLGVS